MKKHLQYLSVCRIGFCVGIASLSGMAQIQKEPAVSVKELKTWFEKIQTISELHVKFSQTKYLTHMNYTLKSTGELILKPDQSIVWKIFTPSLVTVVIKNTLMEITQGHSSQKQMIELSSQDANQQTVTFLRQWIHMDVAMLLKNYTVSCLKPGHFVFEPKQALDSFNRIEVSVAKDKNYISQLILHEKSQDRIQIDFSKPIKIHST